MIKVYFAGPDVFRKDYAAWKNEVAAMCSTVGVVPLFPEDDVMSGADDWEASQKIYRANLAMINRADGIVANLNPFHGDVEPDSGTAFECGYAKGKGKFIVALINDQRSLLKKVAGLGPVQKTDNGYVSSDHFVENFNLPVNLMLCRSAERVAKSMEEVIEYLGHKRFAVMMDLFIGVRQKQLPCNCGADKPSTRYAEGLWTIKCDKCGKNISDEDLENAAEAWNAIN